MSAQHAASYGGTIGLRLVELPGIEPGFPDLSMGLYERSLRDGMAGNDIIQQGRIGK